jgi:GNAT superfamily N-acetyltransferase
VNIEASVVALNDLAAEDRTHIDACFAHHFGRVPYVWAPMPYRVMARVDGDLVGHLGVLQRTVLAGGHEIAVAGIGAVTTHEAYRRRGMAAAMLDRAAEFMRDDLHARFGLLICREAVSPVYERAGWHTVPGPTSFSQPAGPAVYPALTMVLDLGGGAWPSGEIELGGLPW